MSERKELMTDPFKEPVTVFWLEQYEPPDAQTINVILTSRKLKTLDDLFALEREITDGTTRPPKPPRPGLLQPSVLNLRSQVIFTLLQRSGEILSSKPAGLRAKIEVEQAGDSNSSGS